MELCTLKASSPNPCLTAHGLATKTANFRLNPSLPFKRLTHFPGVLSHRRTLLRAKSNKKPSEHGKLTTDKPDGDDSAEDVPVVDNDVKLDNVEPVNQNPYDEAKQPKASKGKRLADDAMEEFDEIFAQLNKGISDGSLPPMNELMAKLGAAGLSDDSLPPLDELFAELQKEGVSIKYMPSLNEALGKVDPKVDSGENPCKGSKSTTDKPDGAAAPEDVPLVDNDIKLDDVAQVKRNPYNEAKQAKPSDGLGHSDESLKPLQELFAKLNSEGLSDETFPPLKELLAMLNIKLDVGDSYKIFLYGGGALVTVWLLSAIVGAFDAIPVFPKLMEVVGLGYSLWFTTRYLLFKENRDEIASKFEELKQEILGSDDK